LPPRKSKVSSSDDSTRSIADSRMEMIRSREFLIAGRGPVADEKVATGGSSTKRLMVGR
jgi:hypothetical protein